MTGRSHQLRLHLASEGFAILGDVLYGHGRHQGEHAGAHCTWEGGYLDGGRNHSGSSSREETSSRSRASLVDNKRDQGSMDKAYGGALRLALHANRLGFTHPITQAWVQLQAGAPEEWPTVVV